MKRTHAVLDSLGSTEVGRSLRARLPRGTERLSVGGVVGASGSALVGMLWENHPTRIFVLVATDSEAANRITADLDALLGEGHALLFPPSETRPYSGGEGDPRIDALRVEAVEALLEGRGRLFVTTPRAIQERMAMPDRLALLHLELKRGDEVGLTLLAEELGAMGYARVPLVEEVGQFAVRGGLIDVFSLGLADPVRVEFWGDEITSIRTFEVTDQRSLEEIPSARLLPAAFLPGSDSRSTLRSFLEILPTDSLVVRPGAPGWEDDLARHWAQAGRLRAEREEEGDTPAPLDALFLPPDDGARIAQSLPALFLMPEDGADLSLGAAPPPGFDRNLGRLQAFLREEAASGASTLILCDNDGQAERLEEILFASGDSIPGVSLAIGTVDAGFRLPSSPPLNVLTDHEIFRRGRRVRSGRRFQGSMALESIAQLSPGDYVVHMDHGIGRFRGLEKIEIAGQAIEVMALDYADGEVLRVPVYRLDLIERWVGATEESEPPPVHHIGGRRWKTLRRRAEAAIEKITRELVELYAERQVAKGFAFSADTKWQTEMEAGFLYEDTPDQTRVTREVKRDMESTRPMDRLICGDVGFGKTEIAIRAAFKAVQDGKQVAFLAPTTILVEQHRRTIEERLADFPVRVASLSRFHTASDQAETVRGLVSGEVDLVVGTHRLLSPDVKFHDLGLLIVDEEQRFGVKHKEALKKLRASVDVLTLTATPIPRTLQLSLARVRDLSIIRTPPPDRLAVSTHAIRWIDPVLAEIMARELDRGGQTFFLHNRVETLHTIAERVHRLAPEARIGVAHGQMGGDELDEVMTGFIEGNVDVLVCSSIIENGLDVPNANTLIVDRADRFGLAQLHQIRGRVGRSNRRAYCYLVLPEDVTDEARQRTRLLERYAELGSGYQIALHDLEMRGAGNLLGADQSGFAHAVGMDTYLRLLDDAVRRIQRGEAAAPEPEAPEVSLPGSAYIPDSYVSDSGQKLHLYRRLSRIEERSEVAQLREEMVDRFGPIPEEVERLLDAQALRLLGTRLGIERVYVKGREGRVTFRASANPRLSALEVPFRDRQVEIQVSRMAPLSLTLRQVGAEPLTRTLVRALEAVLAEPARAA